MTKWEKLIQKVGVPIITWDHEEIKDYLLSCFKRDYPHFLSIALSDTTKRKNLTIVMNYHDLLGDNFSGTINFNKKKNCFDFMTYSDKYNWAVQVSINSGATFFARNHYLYFKHIFPFGLSTKKLTQYLLTH